MTLTAHHCLFSQAIGEICLQRFLPSFFWIIVIICHLSSSMIGVKRDNSPILLMANIHHSTEERHRYK